MTLNCGDYYPVQRLHGCVHGFKVQVTPCHSDEETAISHGRFECEGYYPGDVCDLVCDEGYMPSASTRRICHVGSGSLDGYWSPEEFDCYPIPCPEPTPPLPDYSPGRFNCSGRSFGERCNLVCERGYHSNSTSLCDVDESGQTYWTGDSFVCNPIHCPLTGTRTPGSGTPPSALNGFFECSGHSFGDICTLVCNIGHHMTEPSAISYCNATDQNEGYWTNVSTTCEAIPCPEKTPPLADDTPGQFNCSGRSFGDHCHLVCERGYFSNASSLCEVSQNGHAFWTDGNFVCNLICSTYINRPWYSRYSGSIVQCTSDSIGQICNITCSPGFSSTPSLRSSCIISDDDDHWPEWFHRGCERRQCPGAGPQAFNSTEGSHVTDGSFDCSGYEYGYSCALICDVGFYPANDTYSTCDVSATDEMYWTDGAFICEAMSCPQNGSIVGGDSPGSVETNGDFNCTRYSYGGVCELVCDHGYYPAYDMYSTCNISSDGTTFWTTGLFVCQAMLCPQTGPEVDSSSSTGFVIINGEFNCTRYSYGGVCTLMCDLGYYPAYDSYSTCNISSSGTAFWTTGAFFCEAMLCPKNGPEVASFSPAGFIATNGDFNCTRYSYGGVCELVCELGYYPAYDRYSTCEVSTSNETFWTGGTFVCEVMLCPEVDSSSSTGFVVTNGDFNCTGYSYGGVCGLMCDLGYYTAYDKYSTCNISSSGTTFWTTGTYVCEAIKCPPDGPFWFGDVSAVFHCNGHALGDSCNLTCIIHDSSPINSTSYCRVSETGNEGYWTTGNISSCDPCQNTLKHGSSRYWWLTKPAEWTDASAACATEAAHGHLVIIDGDEEMSAVMSMADNCLMIHDYFWIGNLAEQMTSTDAYTPNWLHGYPLFDTDLCTSVATTNGYWGSYDCQYHFPSLCELEI